MKACDLWLVAWISLVFFDGEENPKIEVCSILLLGLAGFVHEAENCAVLHHIDVRFLIYSIPIDTNMF